MTEHIAQVRQADLGAGDCHASASQRDDHPASGLGPVATDDPTWPRLAVVGTPRSGNTWLRRLVATAYGLNAGHGREAAVHDRELFDWEAEDGPFIVQVHVRHEPDLSSRFRSLGIRALVLSRHPLDVLISILQYANHAANESARWLGGEGGNEDEIRGLHPCHPRFLDYATSERARLLLGISPSWRDDPAAILVRYEDLVGDTEGTLTGLARAIGVSPGLDWARAVAENSLDSMRRGHGLGHVWKGQPGLWRRLLTPEAYEWLADLYLSRIRDPGDGPQPNYRLTREQALANWRAIT